MGMPFHCMICDLPEDRCLCERYCNLCLGDHQVRLCYDGQFYCFECREICELSVQN